MAYYCSIYHLAAAVIILASFWTQSTVCQLHVEPAANTQPGDIPDAVRLVVVATTTSSTTTADNEISTTSSAVGSTQSTPIIFSPTTTFSTWATTLSSLSVPAASSTSGPVASSQLTDSTTTLATTGAAKHGFNIASRNAAMAGRSSSVADTTSTTSAQNSFSTLPPTTLQTTTLAASASDNSVFINNDLASRAALRLPSLVIPQTRRDDQPHHISAPAPSTTPTNTNGTSDKVALENVFVNAVHDKTAAALAAATSSVQTTTLMSESSTTTPQVFSTTLSPPSTVPSLLLSSSSPIIMSPNKPWERDMRLPHDVLPLHYDILLHPDLEEGYFTGKVSIHLHLAQARDNIYLHKKDLNITYVELFRKQPNGAAPVVLATTALEDREAVPPQLQKVDILESISYEKNEFYVIKTATPMQPGDYALNMGFNGTLLGKNKGFYKSVYKNKYNDTRSLATSKFQPTYAREAFPCFDEPSLKSTFNVTLVHADTMTALSNMPEVSQDRRPDGLTETRFAKSVPMVTYLACFIISDFKYIQASSARGVPVRVYATPEQVENNNVAFALEVAQHTLNFFEEYFNISYPLPKLDLVAIPDFVSGAMEHWGLITFREVYLLYDAKEASSANKQRLASVISHEMAHQWFGNLVTTAWWDSLWLNEGFASYMEYYGLVGIEPEWNIMEYFVVGDQQYVMTTDARVSSHPIVVPGLTHPDDIAAIFDSIPYSKGASILRMLENFMGAETFRLGIVRFLNKHIYSTATTDDLWYALNEQLSEQQCKKGPTKNVLPGNASSAISNVAAGLGNEYGAGTQCVDVKQVMDTWLLQMNFPVLHLRRMNDTHGVVQQRRFLLDPSKAGEPNKYESPFDYTWYVPVTYLVTQTKAKGLMWMRHNETTILFSWPLLQTSAQPKSSSNTTTTTASNASSDAVASARVLLDSNTATQRPEPALIKLNPGQYGFYKVNYDLDTWHAISERLNDDIKFLPDARDRSGVLDDAFDMARAGIVPYTVPLSMLRFLKQERSLIVWMTASRSLNFLGERLHSSPEGYSLFRQFVRDMVRPTLAQIGWQDDGTHVERRLRPLLMGLACEQGDSDCLNNVTQMFRQWVHDGTRVPPNFRSVVYNYGMRHGGGEREWQFMLEQLQNTISPQESRMLLYGLTQSSEPWQLNRFLYLAENETFVRRQDFLIVLEYMAANPVGLSCCLWDYFRTQWPNLVARFTLNDRYLGRILPALANYFNEELRLNEVRSFIEQYPDAGAGKLQRQQAIETLEGNIAWLKRNEHTLIQWLRVHRDRKP